MYVERSLEDTYAIGVRNREILHLLAQHCVHAEAVDSGGPGMAEAASGLPINARTIQCQFAWNPVGSGINLEWLATDV